MNNRCKYIFLTVYQCQIKAIYNFNVVGQTYFLFMKRQTSQQQFVPQQTVNQKYSSIKNKQQAPKFNNQILNFSSQLPNQNDWQQFVEVFQMSKVINEPLEETLMFVNQILQPQPFRNNLHDLLEQVSASNQQKRKMLLFNMHDTNDKKRHQTLQTLDQGQQVFSQIDPQIGATTYKTGKINYFNYFSDSRTLRIDQKCCYFPFN